MFKKIRLIVICVLLVVVTGYFVLSLVMEYKFEREIEKIQEMGEPVTFDELWGDLPYSKRQENALQYYNAAFSLLIWRTDHATPMEIIIQQDKEELEKCLEENSLVFEMADQAAKISHCQFSREMKKATLDDTSSLSGARLLTKRLSLRTRYYMMQGRADEAIESLNSSLKMLRILESDLMLIGVTSKAACIRIVIDDIQFITERSEPNQAVLDIWEKELLQLEDLDYVREAAIAERVKVIQDMKHNNWYYCPYDPDRYCLKYPEGNTVEKFVDWLGNCVDDWNSYDESKKMQDWHKHMLQARVLRNWAKLIASLEGKWPGDYETLIDLCEQDHEFKKCGFTDAIGVVKMHGRFLSAGRSARVMCAIERYRLDKGKLPGSLAELVPGYMEAIPLDPFTGKELIFKQDETGYTVYGVSENQKDDGATAKALEDNLDCGVRIRTIINDETEQSEESDKEGANTKRKVRWLRGDEQRPKGEGRRSRGSGRGVNR